jgi:hypothetical protein
MNPLASLAIVTALALSACGGGGGSGSSSGNTTSATPSVFTPAAATVAAKTVNYTGTYFGADARNSYGCYIPTKTVYVLGNSETYVAPNVIDRDQQLAAEDTESSIQEIKTVFGISAATVGFTGSRSQTCIQNESLGGSIEGVGKNGGFLALSLSASGIPSSFLTDNFVQYKHLVKHENVHAMTNTLMGTDSAILDAWFAEGLAEYVAWGGKSDKTKTDLLNLVNTQNPIDMNVSSGSAAWAYYPAFQSVVAYLFDPNGANNDIKTMPAFLAALKADYAYESMNCFIANNCNTMQTRMFTKEFEAFFKERDGTPMKLRTGTNNLRDTVATRLTNFL